VENDTGRPIGILADLQGPKLRVGVFENDEIILEEGAIFSFDMDIANGNEERVCLPHPEIFEALEIGTRLLLDDGKINVEATEVTAEKITVTVKVGGVLSNRKGVNVPDVILPLAALTDKDRADLEFVLELGVDWLGLSFVQRAKDVKEALDLAKGRAAILSKIEKPSAVYAIDEIAAISDAIMVARGDMGVELPMEDVPAQQKKIVRHCRKAGVPVVVATQMLESMIASPVPTRAEVSDVANAVFDGADAIMLSGESAMGKYPVEAVEVMNRITTKIENEPSYRRALDKDTPEPEATTSDAISAAAQQVASTIEAKAIVTYTTSGFTALRAARVRPSCPLLVLTPSKGAARRLTLAWGLNCIYTEDALDFQDMIDKACQESHKYGFTKFGDRIVIMAGMPFGTPGKTNVLRIARVQEHHVSN
jgi:pyruvate kinase